jgi:hypothetical protein
MFNRLRKIEKIRTKKVFDFFKFEQGEKDALLLGDFANKDFAHWLAFVHGQIQAILKSKFIDGNAIENYYQLTMHLGGQRVDVAIVKDGRKGPHELLQDYKKKYDIVESSQSQGG